MTSTLPPPPDHALDAAADHALDAAAGDAPDPRPLEQIIAEEETAHGGAKGALHLGAGQSFFPAVVLFGLALVTVFRQTVSQLLIPEMKADFGLSDGAMLAIGGGGGAAALVLAIPLAWYADRHNRVRLTTIGATLFAGFTLLTAVMPSAWWAFLIVSVGAAVGQATVLPTHNSLLADYYDIPDRPKVYSFHGAHSAIGLVLGALLGGVIGGTFGWRLPYLVIAVPAAVLLVFAVRLREPMRGHYERQAMGLTGELVELAEEPPTLEEAQRLVQRVATMRRTFYAFPFLFIALFGFGLLANLLYSDEFGLGAAQRGVLEAIADCALVVGAAVAGTVGAKLLTKDPAQVFRLVFAACVVGAGFIVLFAASPSVLVGLLARIGISVCIGAVLPGLFSSISLLAPPRARSMAFAMAVLYAVPGFPIVLVSAWISDNWGIRAGVLYMAPVLAIGGYIVNTARKTFDEDVKNVWTAAAARAEILDKRRKGEVKQLVVRDLDVKYGDVQILFGVDFEIDRGEIVALLGTNGAGKSTLLKAITGVVEASNGAILFDGRDITSAPPHEIASAGIAMVPGGQGVFPSLTVGENLKVACWNVRRQAKAGGLSVADRLERVLTTFPVLRDRLGDPAANLSGGQQQMLALGMAFLSQPQLLVIDELSLGLAPVIVEQLIDIVRAIRDQGTTVIVVEQSVNVALTLAETAYFMEKGEIRFHGPTAELLDRPDVLRSVFLEGAAAHLGPEGGATGVASSFATAGAPTRGPRVFSRVPGVAPALELHGLTVRFGGITAVDDVSFELHKGEVLGIIGPNGAGKTTLFDLISGFSRADAGRVLLDGRDITALGPDGRARFGLGRSFQDARLFPALTVEETIKVSLERFAHVRDPFNAMLRLPAQQSSEFELQRQVDELIELMGIESFRTKFVRELSTGSRRVVDLACVLAHRPGVVLLDEPSSGIAQRETEALGPLIHRIRDTLDASIVVIEHDMPLITAVADRLLALDQGHVVVQGTPSLVLNHPEVVASYLGNREETINRSGAGARA